MQGVVIPITMVAGDSFVHRLNPLSKLMWMFGVLVLSFSTRNPAVLGYHFCGWFDFCVSLRYYQRLSESGGYSFPGQPDPDYTAEHCTGFPPNPGLKSCI